MYDLMSWMQRKEAIGISSRAFDLLKGVWKLLAAVLSVRSCRQMYQLLGTPEGGAADGYVKVNTTVAEKFSGGRSDRRVSPLFGDWEWVLLCEGRDKQMSC